MTLWRTLSRLLGRKKPSTQHGFSSTENALEVSLAPLKAKKEAPQVVNNYYFVMNSVTNNNYGMIINGTVYNYGTFENKVNVLTDQGKGDIAKALTELAAAIENDAGLSGQTKKDAKERLDLIAEEAAKRPEERRRSILQDSVDYIKSLSDAATSAAKAIKEWAPLIAAALLAL